MTRQKEGGEVKKEPLKAGKFLKKEEEMSLETPSVPEKILWERNKRLSRTNRKLGPSPPIKLNNLRNRTGRSTPA